MDAFQGWTRRILGVGVALPIVGALVYLAVTGDEGAREALVGFAGLVLGFYFGTKGK